MVSPSMKIGHYKNPVTFSNPIFVLCLTLEHPEQKSYLPVNYVETVQKFWLESTVVLLSKEILESWLNHYPFLIFFVLSYT